MDTRTSVQPETDDLHFYTSPMEITNPNLTEINNPNLAPRTLNSTVETPNNDTPPPYYLTQQFSYPQVSRQITHSMQSQPHPTTLGSLPQHNNPPTSNNNDSAVHNQQLATIQTLNFQQPDNQNQIPYCRMCNKNVIYKQNKCCKVKFLCENCYLEQYRTLNHLGMIIPVFVRCQLCHSTMQNPIFLMENTINSLIES